MVSLNFSCIYLGIGLGTLVGGVTLPTSVCAVVALAFALATARVPGASAAVSRGGH